MRRRVWLIAALVLFALAAFLMMRGDKDNEPPPSREVALPRSLRPVERERMVRRQTLPDVPLPHDGSKPGPPRPRDPLLAALSVGSGKTAMVIEANAIRNSPVGQLLLDCLTKESGGQDPMKRMKKDLNFDPLQDLDRIAVTPNGLVLSGNFKGANFRDVLKGSSSSSYGDEGTLYTLPSYRPDGGARDVAARWGDQIIYVGKSAEDAQDAIDRIEGRKTGDTPITEQMTYGEIYGVLSADDLAGMLPKDQKELADHIRHVASQVELHMDAQSDVGITAQVRGGTGNGDDLQDLGKSLGGLLSMARIQAQAEGDTDAAELLEFAKVVPRGSSFGVEMALPLKVLERQLAWCREPNGSPPHALPDASTPPR